MLTRTASNAIGGSADVLVSRFWFEVKTLTMLFSPSNSLVDLDNFNSLLKLLRKLCICKVAFKKDLKAIFGREEMALALLAVVKADQMVHFEAEFRALSNGGPLARKAQ